jgi:integrase
MIRRRGHLYWEIRLDLPRKPDEPRKQAFHSFRGTRREAIAKEAELRAAIDGRRYVPKTHVNLGEYLTSWLAGARPDLARTTAARFGQLIDRHIVPRLGHLQLDELDQAAIKAAWSDMRANGRLRRAGEGESAQRSLSATTVTQAHRVLHLALKSAVGTLITHNPAHGVQRPKPQRYKGNVLKMDQSRSLLEAVRPSWVYIPALLAFACGLRRGEALALRWRDVDVERGVLTVERSLEHVKEAIAFKAPKNGRVRIIAMPAFAIEELKRHKAEQAALRLQLGLGRDLDMLTVCNPDGSPIHPLRLTKEFARLVAGVPDLPRIRYHDLRHGFVTLQLQLGVPLKVVSEAAGHSTASFTLDRYGHVLEEMRADAAARFDAGFRRKSTTE